MGTFSKSELNTFNFIRWRSATSVTTANISTATIATGNPVDFTNAYISQDAYYFPKAILGREMSVYANIAAGVTDADVANWTCAFFDRYGNVNSGHGTFSITQDNLGGGAYRWYFSATPTTSNFSSGEYYRFVIYNTSTNAVRYVSNFFEMTTDEENTAYITWRNGSTFDSFNYTGLPSWTNKIGLDVNNIEETPEIEVFDYPMISNGRIQTSKTYKKLVISLEAKQFDYEARRAYESVYSCSSITFNGISIARKDAPEWSINRRARLADGVATFYDQRVSEINLNG